MESTPTAKLTPNESMRYDDNYREKYDKIHSTIEDLNTRLMDMFHRKELELLEEYKREMFRAQNELNELRDNTNEEELRRKMIEKKEQLQKERETFLQASIQFSNRCEVFKHKLQRVVGETRDLYSEIKFLNEQIDTANQKNIRLKEEMETLNTIDSGSAIPREGETFTPSKLVLPSTKAKATLGSNRYDNDSSYQQKPLSTTIKRNLSYSNAPPPQANTSRTHINRTREKTQRIREMLADPIFQETDFERMFVDSVTVVKQKKLAKKEQQTNAKALPVIKKSFSRTANNEEEEKSPTDNSLIREFKVSDGELSYYDKRAIMEYFLSRDEVKQYLYKLIFKDAVDAKKTEIKPAS